MAGVAPRIWRRLKPSPNLHFVFANCLCSTTATTSCFPSSKSRFLSRGSFGRFLAWFAAPTHVSTRTTSQTCLFGCVVIARHEDFATQSLQCFPSHKHAGHLWLSGKVWHMNVYSDENRVPDASNNSYCFVSVPGFLQWTVTKMPSLYAQQNPTLKTLQIGNATTNNIPTS